MTEIYKKVTVALEDRSYDIHIGKKILSRIADFIPFELLHKKTFIIYDENTYPYVQIIEGALEGKTAQLKTISIKGGEKAKSFEELERITSWMLDNKIDRHSLIIVVGGGVIGDLGGFASSIVMRGVPFVQVPTTLLSQVDSSVGGKTGINTHQGKNLIGSFFQPKAVICDLSTLKTLSYRELQAGYAEIVKYGLINDLAFYEWLEQNGKDILNLDLEKVSYAVEKSCLAKAAIVAADEKENDARALLNLGHTFGHALEAAAEYDGRLLHGEAVAIGMILAFTLSAHMGLSSFEDSSRIEKHLTSLGMKTKISQIAPALHQTPDELYGLMKGDKKSLANRIGFILVRGIGKAFQYYDVEEKNIRAVISASQE